MTTLNLANLQGNILRGYGMAWLKVFALGASNRAAARKAIAKMLPGAPGNGPKITTAEIWPSGKPPYCLNFGFTFEGLRALGLDAVHLKSFPEEFTAFPRKRQEEVGDVAESAPDQWRPAFAFTASTPPAVHLLALLHGRDEQSLKDASILVQAALLNDGAFTILDTIDGSMLPDERVHFGYYDGIAQPQVDYTGANTFNDGQPLAPAGEFLLGYKNQYGFTYPAPTPSELGQDGTFMAFRMLRQDVSAFEAFLSQHAQNLPAPPGIDPREFLAAKVCGRWRNGTPLSISPNTDMPSTPLNFDELNRFDFVPTAEIPDAFNDAKGVRCPIGSHIRRSNPRGGRVAGGGAHKHRLLRRGIPYGPPFDPHRPDDGQERGLLGLFLCASLKDQFEFLMSEWINGDSFGLRGDLDPLTGRNAAADSRFQIPQAADPSQPVRLRSFSAFVSTRAHAYCFLPSITGLSFLSKTL